MGKHLQPRIAALISDTFANDTIGVLVSGAYSERTVEEEAYSNTSLSDFWESQQGFCPVVPGTSVTPINTLVTTAPFTPNCTPAPGAWTTLRDERLKLGPVRPVANGPHLQPGELLVERKQVLAGTATTPVILGEVRAAGKKPMSATDWARGMRIEAGEKLA